MSGIYRAIAVLTADTEEPIDHFDNPDFFQAQPLTDEEGSWEFTVFADNFEDPENSRYGLTDEAGKISIALAPPGTLQALGLTEEQIDCLKDYVDSDSEPRANGAEQDYYDQLPWPYLIKNGPLATIEELLLIKGFSGSDVYGEDANRNGLLEPNESDGEESFPPDNGDGELDRGLRGLCTIMTREPNVDSEGGPRLNINTANPNSLPEKLAGIGFEQETIDFLVAARKANTKFADPSDLLELSMEIEVEQKGPRGTTIKVKQTMSSGVGEHNLHLVMDKLTTGGLSLSGQEMLFGRVNLISAPAKVLSALPGLSESAAHDIVAGRSNLSDEERATPAWLYTQGIVSAEDFKRASSFLTTRSYLYTVRSFGYRPGSGRFCVLEAVVDLASGTPRITRLRDLTRLGVPLPTTAAQR